MGIHSERQGSVELLKIAGPYLLSTLVYATVVLILEEIRGDHLYKGAGQIGAVFGLAVAFFLGFRMNSAYDRWWEARKVLGELTNNTRSFACALRTYLPHSPELLDETAVYLTTVRQELLTGGSGSLVVLERISTRIEAIMGSQRPWEKNDLMQHIHRFFDIQGKAERIKNTPFLKIYGAFTRFIVLLYAALMPLFLGDIDIGGETSRWELLAIPLTALISSIFLTIQQLANLYAEPFAPSPVALPVATIFTAIESSSALIGDRAAGDGGRHQKAEEMKSSPVPGGQ